MLHVAPFKMGGREGGEGGEGSVSWNRGGGEAKQRNEGVKDNPSV